MNSYEVMLKVALDITLTVVFCLLLGSADPASVVGSFLVAHTINWIFNGHFFVLMRYVWPVPTSTEKFQSTVDQLRVRSASHPYISAVAIYGSYCRGQLHAHSDLDVRVIVAPGAVSRIQGALYCMAERARAVLAVFPLDIYMCTSTKGLSRLRSDERPVILLDRAHVLSKYYGNAVQD